jgi:hypothetical protein
MTEKIDSRTVLVVGVLALVPLLLAITIGFPARASAPAVEVDDARQTEVISPEAPADDTGGAPAVAPLRPEPGFEVILDTGVMDAGTETKISALAITATSSDTDLKTGSD